MNTNDILLNAKNLHAHYDTSHVLHGVDITLHRGETLALLGRNGMGKTTTLRTLMGLHKPSDGVVRIFDRDVTACPPHQIAHEGLTLVPEGRAIFNNLNVRENLMVAMRRGRDGQNNWHLDSVLDLFPRLRERLSHMGNQLSGGEQQMLAIGRALMTNPSLLMLDEATEGLAPMVCEEIWHALGALRKSGMAFIVVDKDVQRVLNIATYVMFMVKGQVAYHGPAQDVLADEQLHIKYLGV